MKRIFPIIAIGIVMALALSVQTGCYYDNEEDLYPMDMCDTVLVTLSGKVEPILLGNCYGCHSASSAAAAGNGINLEDYAPLKSWADNGRLVKSVDHTGFYPMPKGGGRLRQCDIDKIKAWVDRGALDN